MDLVRSWLDKVTANIQDLRSLLGKLLYVVQCFPSAHLFTNRMLETLWACPLQGLIPLSDEFRKDLAWFQWYLPCTDDVFLIHEYPRTPIPLYMDAYPLRLRGGYHYTGLPYGVSIPHSPTTALHLSLRGFKCCGSYQGLGPHIHQTACPLVFRQHHSSG